MNATNAATLLSGGLLLALLATPTPAQAPEDAEAIPTLDYPTILQRALAISPEIRAAHAAVNEARGEDEATTLLPSNPELEVSVLSGHRDRSPVVDFSTSSFLKDEQPFDISSSFYTGTRQGIAGYEVGLSQELDLSGRPSLNRSIAGARIRMRAAEMDRAIFLTRSAVRENVLTLAVREQQITNIQSQLRHLQALRARMGAFRDPRLGTYAAVAFAGDLAELEAEMARLRLERDAARQAIAGLINAPEGDEIPALNPRSIPLPEPEPIETLLARARQYSPDLRIARLEQESASFEAQLADREIYTNPTLFLSYGETRVGGGSTAPVFVGPEQERERSLRFGIRIPLPVFNRGQGSDRIAMAHEERASANYDQIEPRLESTVRQAHARYINLRSLANQLAVNSATVSRSIGQIEEAFIAGRISYLDFWGEYDRTLRMVQRYADTLVEAAAACGELELVTGTPIGPTGTEGTNE